MFGGYLLLYLVSEHELVILWWSKHSWFFAFHFSGKIDNKQVGKQLAIVASTMKKINRVL